MACHLTRGSLGPVTKRPRTLGRSVYLFIFNIDISMFNIYVLLNSYNLYLTTLSILTTPGVFVNQKSISCWSFSVAICVPIIVLAHVAGGLFCVNFCFVKQKHVFSVLKRKNRRKGQVLYWFSLEKS